ncbi:coiled-coil domain-containing protein 115 [Dorcoceras hygrometricum]|uniref:Vacuolar ATPase assembly protein VMA22 n=1 Tax=Dorcoceras hygrometricum TaxID=472368 RepID=A0A2Z7DGN9_9LAMI|nr:coiled-coil domain-containing protein 115 [Dorcoceras hygrometricum]
MPSSENGGIESRKEISEREGNILIFLDSTDSYLILMDSLSSALRQGWFELASARHSMGTSRVNSSLFDLKFHRASTTFQVRHCDGSRDTGLPNFTLCKWASSDDSERYPEEAKFEEDELLQNKPKSPWVLHRHTSQNSDLNETSSEGGGSPVVVINQAQLERSKSLSMFGKLVSPKLRATQLSFERALEILVEISNVRASLLHTHDRVQNDLKAAK